MSILLLLLPCHPERFAFAANLAADASFTVQCYGSGGEFDSEMQLLVGDTMGDMHFYYALADVAFVLKPVEPD